MHTTASLSDCLGCLWIKDKYMDELVRYDQRTSEEEGGDASHEEKHNEL